MVAAVASDRDKEQWFAWVGSSVAAVRDDIVKNIPDIDPATLVAIRMPRVRGMVSSAHGRLITRTRERGHLPTSFFLGTYSGGFPKKRSA